MNINEALEKTWRILEEEEVQTTLGYRYVSNAWPTNRRYQQNDLQKQGWTPAMAAKPTFRPSVSGRGLLDMITVTS